MKKSKMQVLTMNAVTNWGAAGEDLADEEVDDAMSNEEGINPL